MSSRGTVGPQTVIIIKWRVTSWRQTIERVECSGETTTQVRPVGRVGYTKKHGYGEGYFDTYEEAREQLIGWKRKAVEDCEKVLGRCREELEKVRGLVEHLPLNGVLSR